MTTIFQTTFSDAFSWKGIDKLLCKSVKQANYIFNNFFLTNYQYKMNDNYIFLQFILFLFAVIVTNLFLFAAYCHWSFLQICFVFSVSIHFLCDHSSGVIMSVMASPITGVSIVYSIVCSDADERKHQSSSSLAFVRGIHRWPGNSPYKASVARKMFPFDDVIMLVSKSGCCEKGVDTALFKQKEI